MAPRTIKRLLILLPLLMLVALGTVSSRPLASPSLLPPVAQPPHRPPVAGPLYQPINATNAGLNQAAQGALPFLPYLELEPQVNLRQTVGDHTATLYRLYADANQVILAYALTGELTIDRSTWMSATLTDEGGTVFEQTSVTDTHADNLHTYLVTFDTPVSDGIPTTLDLHLRFSVAQQQDVLTTRHVKNLAGPFDFHFTVPVRSTETRVLNLNQTIKADAHIKNDIFQPITVTEVVPMTLEQLIVTPGAARAILHYDLSQLVSTRHSWSGVSTLLAGIPVISLQIGQADGYSYGPDYSPGPPPRDWPRLLDGPQTGKDIYRWSYTLHRTFADQGGEGLLSVSELYQLDYQDMPPPTVTGPWTFQFTVPPFVQ